MAQNPYESPVNPSNRMETGGYRYALWVLVVAVVVLLAGLCLWPSFYLP